MIRWQVVQRSRDLARLDDELLQVHLPHVAARGFSRCDRSVTLRSTLASSVRNSQSIVTAASTSSVFGVGGPLLDEGLDCRGSPLGEQATGVLVGLSGVEQQALRVGSPAAAAAPPGCTGRPWRGSGRRSGRR